MLLEWVISSCWLHWSSLSVLPYISLLFFLLQDCQPWMVLQIQPGSSQQTRRGGWLREMCTEWELGVISGESNPCMGSTHDKWLLCSLSLCLISKPVQTYPVPPEIWIRKRPFMIQGDHCSTCVFQTLFQIDFSNKKSTFIFPLRKSALVFGLGVFIHACLEIHNFIHRIGIKMKRR